MKITNKIAISEILKSCNCSEFELKQIMFIEILHTPVNRYIYVYHKPIPENKRHYTMLGKELIKREYGESTAKYYLHD